MARLSEEYIQRVNEATDIVSVIGDHVKLKRMGSQFTGLCPFHGEKTPSFSVNPGKGVFMCRGCGESGNTIQFLMRTTGAEFQETVAMLAKRAGLAPPAPTSFRQERENGQYNRLHEIMERAKGVYKEALRGNAQSMAYLRDRGVTDEMIDAFEIGYAPRGGQILRDKLKDVSEKDMVAAGLLYKSEYHGGQMDEWMNHRIIFPILSSSGKTLAFGGRSMIPTPKRKYINTPETLLFKKGSEMYGLHQANNAIRKENQVIVTEGYMDSIVPSGSGVGNVVSAMGTAFSSENLRKLFRQADQVVFCFDGDAAGMRAALKAMEATAEFVDEKKSARFAFLPDDMDPDEYVLKNGPQAFRDLIAKSQPLSKFMLSEFSSRNDMTCAEGKAAFASQAMGFIERIQSPMLKVFMIQDVKVIIGSDIPLPGVTEGVPAVVPSVSAEPRRSALRIFRESAKKPAIAPAVALQAPAHDPASKAVEVAQAAMAAKAVNENSHALAQEKASEGHKRLNFRTKHSMITVARESENDPVPSQAVRLLAFLLREPRLSRDEEGPLGMQHLNGSPEEIEAVTAVVNISAGKSDEQLQLLSANDVIATLSQGPHGPIVERASRLPEFLAEDMDVLGEFVGILNRMADRAFRSERATRLRLPKRP